MKWRRTLLEGASAFFCAKWLETLKESDKMWQWRIVSPFDNSTLPCKNLMFKMQAGYYCIRIDHDGKHIGHATGKNQTECVRQYFSMIETYEIQKHNDLIDEIFGRYVSQTPNQIV